MHSRTRFPIALCLLALTVAVPRPAAAAPPAVDLAQAEVTVVERGPNAYGRALGNLDPADWPRMHAGKRLFVHRWRPAGEKPARGEGLGPLYNADSCASCHFRDGRGGPGLEPPPLLFRLGDGSHGWGEQLQDRAVAGAPEGRVETAYRAISGRYGDGDLYRLRQPSYRLADGGEPRPTLSVPLYPRVPPTLIGAGLLEAARADLVLERADPHDRDGDGISGRARWVETPSGRRLGRFGWKAAHPGLAEQVAGALAEDMGLTSPLRPGPAGGAPEISRDDFELLLAYLRMLAPPAERPRPAELEARGRALFESVGCAACHTPRLETAAASEIPGPAALAGQAFYPYTDLLLHDLGPELADPAGEEGIGEGRGDFEAASGEWRTAPLWGLGLMRTVNGGLYLLHDGRARTFEEAILWHGGEALTARRRFQALSRAERQTLVAFLETL